MKKIVLLLAALVVFSSFAYADVGVGIWGRTVFILAYGSNVAEDAEARIWQGWGPDWGGSGPQMGIAVWWTSDLMEYHFKYKYNDANAGGASIPEAYGIVKLMPDMGITLQLGYREEQNDFRETTPTTFHDMNATNCGRFNGWSALVMIEPPDMGLKVGIQWRTDIDNDMPIQYNIYNVGIGVSYTMPEMVKITVGSMCDAEAWENFVFPNQERNIFGRIHLLMVPDLTLWLLAKYTGLEPAPGDAEAVDVDGDTIEETTVSNPDSIIEILLGAKYVMGDFSVALGADVVMNTDKEEGDEDLDPVTGDPLADEDVIMIHANIDPQYNLGNMAVGAVIGMEMKMIEDIDMSPAIYVEPYLKINDFNMNIAFKYAMNSDYDPDTEDFAWSIPIQVDFSFW